MIETGTVSADFLVVGAGIAGASAAAELAAHGRVVLLEMEAQAGYHSTGRSAAFFAAAYGNELVRGLTALSEQFFVAPPDGFSETPLIRLKDCMYFGRPDQQGRLREMQAGNPRLEFKSEAEVIGRVPIMKPGYLHGAMRDYLGGDIDVDAVLQGYVRLLRRRGSRMFTARPVTAMHHDGGLWRARAAGGEFSAPVVVNAAGAWADRVAEMSGIPGVGLKPLLRSALLIDPPGGHDIDGWPLMIDVDDDFYFKPDAGQLMISPADEIPCEPCDAQPDDVEMARGIDRFEKATGVDVRKVNHRWAGLRTFAPDRKLVAGFDPRATGFFWLAGQGGYGVQSAPGMAHLTAALVAGSTPPAGFEAVLDFAGELIPDRLLR